MITPTLYVLGLLCRFGALFLAGRVLWLRFSWRFVVVTLGVVWISVQPILQYFFSGSLGFISAAQAPEVFFITSAIALIAIYHLHEILTDNDRYAKKATDETVRFGRRQSILLELSKQRGPDLIETLTSITNADSEELKVGRVGIWMFNGERNAFHSLLFLDQGVVNSESFTINKNDYPAYFAALDGDGVLVADDARSHPGSQEFEAGYLRPNNIFAMLDVPIRIDGEIAGIICHENLAACRHWLEEDQDFAHSIADLCALAIAADKQRETEAQLRESRRHMADAQNAGQFGGFRWDLRVDRIVWSGEVMAELGFTDDDTPQTEKFRATIVDAYLEPFDNALRGASVDRKPFRVRLKTKPEFGGRYYETRGLYFENETFRNGCFEGSVHNITEQVLAEEENQRLEEQLIQSQKMESIGTLAGGIAHDFNNILTPILGYTDVALAELEPNSPLREPLEEVLNGSLRAKDLVKQILIFSRRWDEKREPLNLEDSIQSALKLIRPTVPAAIRIDVEIVPDHKLVEADSTQMVQVILNLCTNAWHAMEPKGGRLGLRLYPTMHDGKVMTALSVSDSGNGIEEEAIPRVFDPFFTTKDVGKGTGLGLSVVHGIVAKHGGQISVDSKPGATTFTVFLPSTDKLPTPESSADEPAPNGSASILLVDDDEAVARILESMLQGLGYEIDVHSNGDSALESFKQSDRHYDLLMTDLSMPTMSGVELTRKIRELDSELPVLILSGHGKSQISSQLVGIENCQIISKPIVQADLAMALKKELH